MRVHSPRPVGSRKLLTSLCGVNHPAAMIAGLQWGASNSLGVNPTVSTGVSSGPSRGFLSSCVRPWSRACERFLHRTTGLQHHCPHPQRRTSEPPRGPIVRALQAYSYPVVLRKQQRASTSTEQSTDSRRDALKHRSRTEQRRYSRLESPVSKNGMRKQQRAVGEDEAPTTRTIVADGEDLGSDFIEKIGRDGNEALDGLHVDTAFPNIFFVNFQAKRTDRDPGRNLMIKSSTNS